MADLRELDQDERNAILHRMVEGLHALIFGTYTIGSGDYALKALGDGGSIHEYVHGMLWLLPERCYEQVKTSDMDTQALARREFAHAVADGVTPPFAHGSWQHAVDDYLSAYGKTSQEFTTPHEAVQWLLQITGEAAVANAGVTPTDGGKNAESRVEAWDRLERENAALRAALAPFARLADKPLGFAAVEYTVRGDPERQTFNAPQMQRAFNRAAEVYAAHRAPDGVKGPDA